MRWIVGVVVLSGCMVGGGPVLGVGHRHGVFWGGEMAAGAIIVAQGALGYQSTGNLWYGRFDAVYEAAAFDDGAGPPIGGRIGLGGGINGDAALAIAGVALRAPVIDDKDSCSGTATATMIGLDVRYVASEWQLVLAPRLEAVTGLPRWSCGN